MYACSQQLEHTIVSVSLLTLTESWAASDDRFCSASLVFAVQTHLVCNRSEELATSYIWWALNRTNEPLEQPVFSHTLSLQRVTLEVQVTALGRLNSCY